MATKSEKTIELNPIKVMTAIIDIAGDTDCVCNKMNDVVARQLVDIRKDKAKKVTEKPNEWEEIITSIHWRDGKPKEFSEASMIDALTNNAPCITSFGLMKSFGDAVVRNEIDKYATKFRASVNVIADGGLVPIKFTEHFIDEKLMSPQKGRPVLVKLNRFTGWSASIKIQYVETAYSIEQITNIVNLAGFGIGIGSGRTSGYGRYHVTNVRYETVG